MKKRTVAKKKVAKKRAVPNIGLNKDLYRTILDNLYDGVYFIDNDKKITYWNKAAERLTGYRAEEVVGKKCSDSVISHVNDKGLKLCLTKLCPADAALKKGELHEEELWMHHKDGHRIYVLTRMTPMVDKDGKVIGAVEIFSDNSKSIIQRRRNEKLSKMALLDPLTELGNRRFGEINLRSRLNEMRRYGWPFGILFIDVDHFKAVNDRYNHEIGDRVLKMVGNTFLKNTRAFDTFVRWGGEEFLGILTNVNEGELFVVADRFRALIEQSSFDVKQESVRVTVSVGACVAQQNDTVESLIKRADELMYHSKSAGMNRVSMK